MFKQKKNVFIDYDAYKKNLFPEWCSFGKKIQPTIKKEKL